MKTIKILASVLILTGATIATAVEKPKTNVHSVSADKFLVAIENAEASNVEVTINDNNGEVVYYKQTYKPIDSYKKIFDVKDLENGEYSIELKTKEMVSKRELVIAEERIVVGAPAEQVAVPPYFGFDGEKLVISHLNFDKEKYKLAIYNFSNTIYEATVSGASPMIAAYDLSKLKPGDYEVVLYSDNKIFDYSFKK